MKQFNTVSSDGYLFSKLYFSFTNGVDVSSIKACLSQLYQSERGISCLIVDPVVLYPTAHSLYRKNIKTLKEIAQQFNVPVVVTSRTSRAAEQRVNKESGHPAKQKPIVEDICFSSIVKDYADVVLLMEFIEH
ncbi:MAG: DnaB-like helicase C-terminal domain-containing protein [Succinivibrio dextrinosolvens]|nr:DnaB-like helicase C-terminal domain-containing protein [Succinivibrio dextrinosolvens]MDY6469950.1 DnaB-like helicase C-terminal domain-containing protein [Succinivibrio dextrinosolvens]